MLGDAVLTSTHNLCFGAKIRKIGIPLHTPALLSRGYTLHGHVILMRRAGISTGSPVQLSQSPRQRKLQLKDLLIVNIAKRHSDYY